MKVLHNFTCWIKKKNYYLNLCFVDILFFFGLATVAWLCEKCCISGQASHEHVDILLVVGDDHYTSAV